MRTKKYTYRLIILLLTFLFVSNENTKSQEVLDLLPSDRNIMFHSFLMARGDSIWNARRNVVEQSLVTDSAIYARQKQLYNDYVMLLGDLPEKTALNAVIIDTITTGDVYHIERLHYQSIPNHHITANFYIPDTGTAPFPTVYFTCGHYPTAKVYQDYQSLCILFAKHGIAVLIAEPIGQGERYQVLKNDGVSLEFTSHNSSGTSECAVLEAGSELVGLSVTAYELWDNHRSIDYLYSRPDVVDTSKIGCAGHSGGGKQAMYLLGFDIRIKVGTVIAALTNEENLYNNLGPQTSSQHLSYLGAYGIEQVDLVTMFAPKPYMIISADDGPLFPTPQALDVYNEAKTIYDSLGVGEKMCLFATPDGIHDVIKNKREATVRWFRRWFYNDNDTIIEGTQSTIGNSGVVTGAGQVMYEFEDELNVTQLNVNLADSLADNREAFWTDNTKDSCLNKVAELLHMEDYKAIEVVDSGTIDRSNYTVQRLLIKSGDNVPVPALQFEPKSITGKLPAVLYVDGRGKKTDASAGGIIEQIYVDSGNIVLAIDVRGFGETSDSRNNDSKYYNNEYRNSVIGGYIGKTLIGQRVEDIRKALEVLEDNENVNTDSIIIVGIGDAGPVVLHAAALDTVYKKAIIRLSTFESWIEVVSNPLWSNMLTHAVPGALKYYDLPDLVDAIAPREVEYAEEPVIIGVNNSEVNNDHFALGQNYPNPFKESTTINYTIAKSGNTSIQVYDQVGRLVDVLVNQPQDAGTYNVELNASSLTSGVYFYQLVVDNKQIGTKKMVVLP